jgi:hypothetical protein
MMVMGLIVVRGGDLDIWVRRLGGCEFVVCICHV